eukprot:6490753-Amphidinium_carterae.4
MAHVKDIKCRFCGMGFSQFIHNTDIQTFAASCCQQHLLQWLCDYFSQSPSSSSSQCSQPEPAWPAHSSTLQSTRKSLTHCTTSEGVLPQWTQYIVEDDKGALRSTHIAQTMAGTSEHHLTEARNYKAQE